MSQVQQELEAIREEMGGILRAEDVVRFAQNNPDSALHRRFTWDDSVAAVQHRLNEARSIIRVHVFILPGSTQTIRTYVSLHSDRQQAGGGYRSIGEVMRDTDRRKMLLRDALRELERWKAKYSGLKELAKVFASAQELLDLEAEINNDTLDLAFDNLPKDPAPAQ
jgi:hypothetical protein